ncbi:MAG TPA: hypothetical protein VIL13_09170 [Longimicrobiales bacterium]
MRRTLRTWWLLPLVCAAPLAAQDTTRVPTGVRLGLIYQTQYRPKLAVAPFTSQPEAANVAAQIHAIVQRDLDYSDRFEMTELSGPITVGPEQYRHLNNLGVVFLLTGNVEPNASGGYQLSLELHDIVYQRVRQSGTYVLPSPSDRDFRLSVHAASDEVVFWATGQPGMAASRVVFVRKGRGGYQLLVVDSDGEQLQEIAWMERPIASPVWSPDGKRIAYTALASDGQWDVLERDLATGNVRAVAQRRMLNLTPAYSPDGTRLAYAVSTGPSEDLYEVDLTDQRIRLLRRDAISPTYSPDGRHLAFNSSRLGQPHIYVMPIGGGEAALLSPFLYGEPGYYTSPDWSPTGSLVAFHGRSRGPHQIMVADASKPGSTVHQLTSEGWNEDPSWAPDGRHLVFSSVRDEGTGLYVMDTVTGRTRPLVLGGQCLVPDWSPRLLNASTLALRQR